MVQGISLKEGSSFQLFHGFRVDTDQDLVHDVDHHAEESEKHHLTQGFHFCSWELGVSRDTGFFWIKQARVFCFDFWSEIKTWVFSYKFSYLGYVEPFKAKNPLSIKD